MGSSAEVERQWQSVANTIRQWKPARRFGGMLSLFVLGFLFAICGPRCGAAVSAAQAGETPAPQCLAGTILQGEPAPSAHGKGVVIDPLPLLHLLIEA